MPEGTHVSDKVRDNYIKEFLASGIRASEFARLKGLSETTLRGWVRGKTGKGRKNYSAEEKKKYLAEYRKAPNKDEYARQVKIASSTLHRWDKEAGRSKFVDVSEEFTKALNGNGSYSEPSVEISMGEITVKLKGNANVSRIKEVIEAIKEI